MKRHASRHSRTDHPSPQEINDSSSPTSFFHCWQIEIFADFGSWCTNVGNNCGWLHHGLFGNFPSTTPVKLEFNLNYKRRRFMDS